MGKIHLSGKYTNLSVAIGQESWTWDPSTKVIRGGGVDRGTAPTMDAAEEMARQILLKNGDAEAEAMFQDILRLQKTGDIPSGDSWYTRAAYNLSEALRKCREENRKDYATVQFGSYIPDRGFCEVTVKVKRGIPDSGVPYWPDSFVPGTPDRVVSISATTANGEEFVPDQLVGVDSENFHTLGQIALMILTSKDRTGANLDGSNHAIAYARVPIVGVCRVVGRFEKGTPPVGKNGPPENYDPGEPDRVDLTFLSDVRPVGLSYDYDDFWGLLATSTNQYAQRVVDDLDDYLLKVYRRNQERSLNQATGVFLIETK